MKLKKNKKPTNKDLRRAIQDIQYRLMATQSQVNALTEIFSDFLDFTHKKAKFTEYLERKVERDAAGSVANPEVKQEPIESI